MKINNQNNSFEKIERQYGISKKDVLTVTELNEHIKKILSADARLNQVYVIGEITGSFRHPSGYIFFSIKDQNSVIKCAYPKKNHRNLRFHLKDGLEILVLGSLLLRERKGTYQIQVNTVYPIGAGVSHLEFAQTKEKLARRGFFDERYKKEIPTMPRNIGLISSEGSQGYTDVIEGLKSRFPNITVKFISAPMQGDRAPVAIEEAIKTLGRMGVEVIIIARGGGPAEEMMCFNDEKLARGIFYSKVPIITGIGHEADQSIADLIADKRAATPSMAAKVAVPRKEELITRINLSRDKLQKGYNVFVKSVQREKILKRYKVVVAIIVAAIIILSTFYFIFHNKTVADFLRQKTANALRYFEIFK